VQGNYPLQPTPTSGCLWLHTFRSEIPPASCFHIAATHRALGPRALPQNPLYCVSALTLPLGLKNTTRCLPPLVTLAPFDPCQGTELPTGYIACLAFHSGMTSQLTPTPGSAGPMTRPSRACVLNHKWRGYVGFTPFGWLPDLIHRTRCLDLSFEEVRII
jgi:hypothetical protein